MSQFEFVSMGVSIVIALAVARLLEGLRDTFDPERMYSVHALWVITKLLNSAIIYWGAWVYGWQEDMDFLDFILLLIPPGVMFIQVHALVTPHPDRVADWAAHYWKIRRLFFNCNLVLVIFSGVNIHFVGQTSFPSPDFIPLGIIFVISLLGLISDNPRLHGVMAVIAFLNLSIGFGLRFVGII